jgi:peptidoglycan/xylan/chitin deacetylase (PgdA/CDA1 family)
MKTKEVLRRAADEILVGSPLQPTYRWLSRTRLRVLAYHGVEDTEQFKGHLDVIERYAQPVTLDDVLAALSGNRRLPNHAVLLTFDDNDRRVVEVALPLLAETRIPAVVFVIAGLLDRNEQAWFTEVDNLVHAGARLGKLEGRSPLQVKLAMKAMPDAQRTTLLEELRASVSVSIERTPSLTTEDLKLLKAGGVEVGNHTFSHPCLNRCSTTKIEWELGEAHRVLEKAIGHPPRAMAYPNGDCDDRVLATARRLGYTAGFLFDHSLSPVPVDDPLRISRLRIDSTASPERLRIILSGLHPAVHAARFAIRGRLSALRSAHA